MPEERTIRIFCFGDSLTAGYSAYGAVYHPYSITLAKKLSRDLSNTRVVATDNGMPGDVVSQGAFEKRFESESECFTCSCSVYLLSGGLPLLLNLRACILPLVFLFFTIKKPLALPLHDPPGGSC